MNIGVVGYGVVGQAVAKGLENTGHLVMVNDIDEEKSKFTKRELVEECEIIFICVPTPTIDLGCDLRHVYQAFNDLHLQIAQVSRTQEGTTMPIIVIKSTVLPGTCDTLKAMYPFVAYNPEFLRQDTAPLDFLNTDRIVIGCESDRVHKKMHELYDAEPWGIVPKHYMELREAELVKYLSNAFLVTKVAFSQDAAGICKLLNADAVTVMDAVVADKRIGRSHMAPELGKIPIDSPCLPKDIKALIMQLEKSGENPLLLKVAYAYGVQGVSLAPSLQVVEVEE